MIGTTLASATVGLALLTTLAGCLVEQQLTPPEGAEVDPSGVVFARRDNPVVQGNAYLIVEDELGPSGPFTARKVISPDGAFITADQPGVLADPWVWSAAAEGSISLGAPGFRAPRVSLPMGGTPVAFSLHTKRGRVRTTPVPPGTVPPPLGFDEDTIDTLSIALHPRVLVLPVRVHRFISAQGPPSGQVTPAFVTQVFDPGAVATESQLTTDDGFASRVTVVSGELGQAASSPDPIWTQCDIQFHLEEYEEIPQFANLEIVQTTSCVCGNSGIAGVSQPISAFLPGRDGSTAIDLFLGGSISGSGCPAGTTQGITCGPGNSGLGGSCEDVVGGHEFDVILLNQSSFLSTANLVSHELGHMLGLRHPGDGLESGLDPDDTAGAENLLMFTGGGGTEPVITPSQCARARCMAASWLEAFGRLSATERDAVCSE